MQWTPAHGRMPEWRPTAGHADELRKLNHAADSAATRVLQQELHRIQAWLTTQRHAEDWAAQALAWARHVAIMWDTHVASAAVAV
jgi:hypothetical protein